MRIAEKLILAGVLLGGQWHLEAHGRREPNPTILRTLGEFSEFAVLGQNCSTVLASVEANPAGLITISATRIGDDLVLRATLTKLPEGDTSISITVSWTTNCPEQGGVTQFNVGISPRLTTKPTTQGGNLISTAGQTGDPISTATGELFRPDEQADLALGGPMPLEFRRYYASLLKAGGGESTLGTNWMHNFDARLQRSGSTATVILFRGKNLVFQQSGANWTLAAGERRNYQLVESNGGYRFLDALQEWIYSFNSSGALVRIEDRNGNALVIEAGPAGPLTVGDGLGRVLRFRYSGSKLVRVEDQTGRAVSFEQTGDLLTTFVDAANQRFGYTYKSQGSLTGLMTAEIMPEGNIPLRHEYDDQGRVVRQLDSNGNALSLTYDSPAAGKTTVRNALGSTSIHTHQGASRLTAMSDAAGNAIGVSYDGRNNPIGLTDRLGHRMTLAYDGAGNLISQTDAGGNITRFTWLAQVQGGFTFWVLTGIAHADGTSHAMTYDLNGNMLTMTDRAGKTTTFTYNPRGWLTSARNAAGGITRHIYNEDGTRASTTLPMGEVIQFGYDEFKRVAEVRFADGSTQRLVLDALDRLASYRNERQQQVVISYSDNGYPRLVTGLDGQTTRYSYNGDNRLSTITDPLGRVERRAYDAAGHLLTMTNGAGEARTRQYDELGRIIGLTDGVGGTGKASYNADGRMTAWTDEMGRRNALNYEARQLPIEILDGLSQRKQFAYDSMKRLIRVVDGVGNTETRTYSPYGLTSWNLPVGVTAKFDRNELNQVIVTTDAMGNLWRREFDAQGRLVAWIDPLGRRTVLQWGPRDRLRRIDFPDGSVENEYDPVGNLIRASYSDGTLLGFGYDERNRLKTGPGLTLDYDAAGQLTGSNGLRFTRDGAGRLTSVTYAAGKTVLYDYDQRGQVTRVRDWANGMITLRYDNSGRVIAMERSSGRVTRYAYAANGELESIAETGGSGNFSIALRRDAANRIIQSERTLPATVLLANVDDAFEFDGAQQNPAERTDKRGRVLADARRTYVWDQAARLTKFDNGSSNELRQDGLGYLILGRGEYVWNHGLGLPSIAILRSQGTDQRYYVHLPNGILLESIEAVNNERHYFHYDESGNTTFLSDDKGAVTDSYAITAYGEVVRRSGSTYNPFTYQGAFGVLEVDPGLYSMRARFYDAKAGRFLSRDALQTQDPRGINPYQYAYGNPISNHDPTGNRVVCYSLGGTLTFIQGGSASLQYCSDECTNWGCFLAGSARAGLDIGLGLSVSVSAGCLPAYAQGSGASQDFDVALGVGPLAVGAGLGDTKNGPGVGFVSGGLTIGLDFGLSFGYQSGVLMLWGDLSNPCPCDPWYPLKGFRFAYQVPQIDMTGVEKPPVVRRGGTVPGIGPAPNPY